LRDCRAEHRAQSSGVEELLSSEGRLNQVRLGQRLGFTERLDPKVKVAIAPIDEHAWTTIEYTDAVYDDTTRRWISRAEVAEIAFTAFTSKKAAEQVPGRLVVHRIPDLNPGTDTGQDTLFDTWRFHAFFTTGKRDTITADKPRCADSVAVRSGS
jgi:hypothetical protein